MPQSYGSTTIAWRRLKRWSEEGIWNQIMESFRDSAYQKCKFSLETVCVASSFIETKKGERVQMLRWGACNKKYILLYNIIVEVVTQFDSGCR
ncbi:MAG: hypothetical protein JXA38_04205 [Methanosarcinaceae archaeon]|nr:hypothetical protein [Methanosarcinaceae archaeon]